MSNRTSDLLRDFAPDEGAWTVPSQLVRRAADELDELHLEVERLRNVILALNESFCSTEWDVSGEDQEMLAWNEAWRNAFLVECELRPSGFADFHANFHRLAMKECGS